MIEDKNKYQIEQLSEYQRQSEPHRAERSRLWQTAIGLQQVDHLPTSEYLLDTARRHIEGEITTKEVNILIDKYYHARTTRVGIENETFEGDKVSGRILELLSEPTFSFNTAQYINIHHRLFKGIYKFAGTIRDYNITKREWVLRGDTVYYSGFDMIRPSLEYDLQQEHDFDYSTVNADEAIAHLCRFCSNLWQIHAFGEGNTRTTAVFMIKYLRRLGFKVTNDMFARHSWYFRNALVRANYADLRIGVAETTRFLEAFFRNMLLGENTPLRNREMHLDWKPEMETEQPSQSAKTAPIVFPKCKNCTLSEAAVVSIIRQAPKSTQKEIAAMIGKSERTVKTLTVGLQERGILIRQGGRRNGFWTVNEEEL